MTFGFGMGFPRNNPRSGGPALNLQFAGSTTLDPRITFTRASTGTYIDSAGALQSAAINVPRFDYNPTTLQPLGLLIEEARTNILLNSATLSTQSVTVTGVAHTLSFYGTGTVTITGTGSGTLTGSGAFPTRSTLTFTPTIGVLILTVTGSVTQAQLEAGAFATSYIPTTSASATRAIDLASMTGTNFSDWYKAEDGGTLFATASVMYGVGTVIDGVASLDDNTASNRIQIRRNSTNQIPSGLVVAGGTAFFNTGASGATAVAANAIFSIGLAYDTNNTIFGDRGLLSTVDTSVTVPTVTQLQIGNGASIQALNGRISRLVYYPRRLANAELQSLTV